MFIKVEGQREGSFITINPAHIVTIQRKVIGYTDSITTILLSTGDKVNSRESIENILSKIGGGVSE